MSNPYFIANELPDEAKYNLLSQAVQTVLDKNEYAITNLSNFCALLKNSFSKISWVGFYLSDGKELYLGPFQGMHACTKIAYGRGVCGTSAMRKETIIVQDVLQFPGHVACDPDSVSEIVVPLMRGDELLGVLDLDSYRSAAFGETDRRHLENILNLIVQKILPGNFTGNKFA